MKPKTREQGSKIPKKGQISGDLFSSWHIPVVLLVTITFLVYFRTLFLEYTRLDDSIFIVENARYNADLNNIWVSFQRGLFNPTKDAYYRPLFLVDFIIESRFFGTNPAGYHFTNLLFHIISVVLLYFFFKRVRINGMDAFVLTLLFSVHPVLTQAVAWIPGRNDMLLMIFFLAGFILFLKYLEKPNPLFLLFQALFFLAALFTKETAMIIPVIMLGFVLTYLKISWKKTVVPAGSWILAALIYFYIRSTATLAKDWISPAAMFSAGLERLGVIVQYIGKIFLPVNLTVFPEYQDVSLIWGFISIGLFTALIIFSRSYTKPLTYIGLFWFLIFLVPVLIVPKSLNDQIFEHRLYLPIVGILLMLSQTIIFQQITPRKTKLLIVGSVVLIFSIVSIYRSAYFKDGITFWRKAVEGSPNSAYAHTLLGTKVSDEAEREKHFRIAYQLNPDLKNLNYYLGKVIFEKKQPDSAEYYLRRELAKNPIPNAWFLLAQIAFERSQFDSAARFLENVISLDPYDPQANHNLVLLYYQNGQQEKAKAVMDAMYARGMDPGQDLVDMMKKKDD